MCLICLLFFPDNDTAESVDRIDEKNWTNLRMKLKKNTVDEEKEDEEENKIDVVYPISEKRTRVSTSVPRRTIALQSRWWPTT